MNKTETKYVNSIREELRLVRGERTLYEAALREISSGLFGDAQEIARKALAQGIRNES